jgi:hypothetical protein
MSKELLKHIGESTAYSAKGHFKTADIRRISTYLYIVVNIVFAVMAISGLFAQLWIQILSVISLVASILLLISETHGGLGICSKHSKFGNMYLELHNDTYAEFLKERIDQSSVEKLQERLNKLNKTERPNINLGGRYWGKYAIEKSGEMTKWWK